MEHLGPASGIDDHLHCEIGVRGARWAWVGDLEVALDFFLFTLGFERLESPAVAVATRLAEVAPPGNGASLILAEASGPAIDNLGGSTGVVFETSDLERATGYLEFRGVHYEPVGSGAPPRAVRLFDPDSSHYMLVEVGSL